MRFKKALLSGLLGQPTISAQVLALLRRRGDSLLIPGVGIVDGFSSGTYSDSAGATPAVLDDFLGRWVDAGSGGLAFTQATTPNKPLLTKRVNLLTKTEDFSHSAWTRTDTSITGNAAIAPDGTLTTDKLVAGSDLNQHGANQVVSVSGRTQVSAWFKSGEYTKAVITTYNAADGVKDALFDLSAGLVVTERSCAARMASEAGGFRCTITPTAAWTSSTEVSFRCAPASHPSADPRASWIGNDTDGGYVWGAQVGDGRYQRVNTATDYDTVGFPYRVRFGASQTLSASIPLGAGYADTTIISALPGGQVTLTGQNLSGATHTIGPNLDLLGRIYAFNGSSLTAAELGLYQRYMNNLAGVA